MEFENRSSGETTQKTTQKTVERILDLLRGDPSLSRRAMAKQLGDITEDGVKYHLDKLRSDGRIRRVGPAKGGRWEILE